MKCPYCAEDIKDEAIVCSHCQRDLTFFKPFQQTVADLKSEVSGLRDCVEKMAVSLDRQPIEESGGGQSTDSPKPKKPRFWGRLFFAFLQFVLTVGLLAGLVGLVLDLKPTRMTYATGVEVSSEIRELEQRQNEEYDERVRLIAKVMLGSLFASPILLGVWIGLRWHGRNLKNYLLVGLMAASIDAVILIALFGISMALDGHQSGDVSFLILFIIIDLFRCLFGFATGGLIGDWIERIKYPQRYHRGFAEALIAKRHEQAQGFDRVTFGVGRLATSVGPIVPLIGVIVTSLFGFYTAKLAVRKAELDKKDEKQITKPAENLPAQPTPQATR